MEIKEIITSKDWSGTTRTLVHSRNGVAVKKGEIVANFRGELRIINGGTAPHKDSSTGRISTNAGELFPSVCNLEWK